MNRALAIACALAAALSSSARADSFVDSGEILAPTPAPDLDSPWSWLSATANLRERAAYLYNFDLDRGLTPSGAPVFPVPNDTKQGFVADDFRLRTDFAAQSRSGIVDAHVRVDVLDDASLSGTSLADASGRATDAQGDLRLRLAYAEILTPVGVVVAGRVANQFGLGMVANDGNCLDCDGGDAADRIALVVPAHGLFVAAALDLSETGQHTGLRADSDLSFDPRTNPHAVTLAVARYRGDVIRAIRRRGDRTTVDWAGSLSYVWQGQDVPADYLPVPAETNPATMQRGLAVGIAAGWIRIERRELRIEAEGMVLDGSLQQGSLIPGALYRRPIEMLQWGAALESDLGDRDGRASAGFDSGVASGDPAPGFGAEPSLQNTSPVPGDLDGAQANPPFDNRIDNFRFSPDYRIDKILFHQIIGTVTDAVYLRPHARLRLAEVDNGALTATAASITSWAMDPSSTPSGRRFLGEEVDLGVNYHARFGLTVAVGYAVFLPGPAFDNPSAGLAARPAQLVDTTVGYVF